MRHELQVQVEAGPGREPGKLSGRNGQVLLRNRSFAEEKIICPRNGLISLVTLPWEPLERKPKHRMPFLASPKYHEDQRPMPSTASQLFFSPPGSFSSDTTIPSSVTTIRGKGYPQVQIACDEGLAGVGLVLHQVFLMHQRSWIAFWTEIYESGGNRWRDELHICRRPYSW